MIVEAAISMTGANKGNLQTLDEETMALTIAAHRGFETPFLTFFSTVRHDGAAVCAQAMRSNERVIVEDITKSPLFAGQPSLGILLESGVRAIQSTPLISSAGALLGMISTHFNRPHRPSERELRLVDLLARLAADYLERKHVELALRNSQERLRSFAGQLEGLVKERTQELVHSQSRLRALAIELNLAEQRERKRLATELHDHLSQMLALGKLKLGQGKRLSSPACADLLQATDDVLSDALTYTRTLIAELSPPVLREHGLAAGLKWLGQSLTRHNMEVLVEVPDDAIHVREDDTMLLFQSVRELLINASKYAGTGKAKVTLRQCESEVRIVVWDEGVGFDLAAAAAADIPENAVSSKFGLFSIRERMKALGGSFDLQSAPGHGTTATLTLPLAEPVKVSPSPAESIAISSKTGPVSLEHSQEAIEASHALS